MSETWLKATHVSHGTTFELGSIFTSGPAPGNQPKCYTVENVQKNYIPILALDTKNGK